MYKLPITIQGWEVKSIIRIEDNSAIPFDEANKDYQQYLKWLEAGNTPLPADEGAV